MLPKTTATGQGGQPIVGDVGGDVGKVVDKGGEKGTGLSGSGKWQEIISRKQESEIQEAGKRRWGKPPVILCTGGFLVFV
ncbi:hypothetical protein [Mucilaginibacter celer]|uniref:Uncharacterized protein n=1 Tax=Mucilaginibacter celer TaxID=2305508 RepID=A0A494VH91_9SPHI|nr:hypothetical protein [Mucilaginibacter celer]AYL94026.1 hypothetical protein HYN43_001385 [Mucilaginibacter celer]